MREMKKAMVKKRGEVTFCPITIRPQDQISFDVSEEAPFPSFQAHLRKRYASRTLTFRELMNDDYPTGHPWIEGHYKKAVKAMAVTFSGTPPLG